MCAPLANMRLVKCSHRACRRVRGKVARAAAFAAGGPPGRAREAAARQQQPAQRLLAPGEPAGGGQAWGAGGAGRAGSASVDSCIAELTSAVVMISAMNHCCCRLRRVTGLHECICILCLHFFADLLVSLHYCACMRAKLVAVRGSPLSDKASSWWLSGGAQQAGWHRAVPCCRCAAPRAARLCLRPSRCPYILAKTSCIMAFHIASTRGARRLCGTNPSV